MNVTATELIILNLLLDGDSYGLELVKKSEGKLKRGGIYVLLQRLEEKGFISSSKDPRPDSEGPSYRRSYSISNGGRMIADAHRSLGENLNGLKLA